MAPQVEGEHAEGLGERPRHFVPLVRARGDVVQQHDRAAAFEHREHTGEHAVRMKHWDREQTSLIRAEQQRPA